MLRHSPGTRLLQKLTALPSCNVRLLAIVWTQRTEGSLKPKPSKPYCKRNPKPRGSRFGSEGLGFRDPPDAAAFKPLAEVVLTRRGDMSAKGARGALAEKLCRTRQTTSYPCSLTKSGRQP